MTRDPGSPARRRTLLALSLVLLAAACGGSEPAAPNPPVHGPSASAPDEAPPTPREPDDEAPAFHPGRVGVRLRLVAEGLDSPLLVTNAGDGSGRLFVLEQGGRIRIVAGRLLLPNPFLDLTDLTEGAGERGLLGLAFHPDYKSNGRLFVNYTDNAGDTVIAEYRRTEDDPARADPASARILLRVDQPFSNHNGGNLVFGPDGFMYIGMGDGGSAGDPFGLGQRLDTLLGKLLRIDVDRRTDGRPYAIPRDNPFVGRAGARSEIWAYGLRNPWRFSFDRETGDLWIGDVGQDRLEEIDRTRAGDGGGLNYGWDVMEGNACFEPIVSCDREGLVGPIAVYSHELGCSVTGGHVYRGEVFPELRGGYFFADFCSGTIWALDASGSPRQEPVVVLETAHAISSFGEDEAGELYLTDLVSGQIFQIVPG